MNPRYLTVEQAAAYAGLTRQAIYQRIYRAVMPGVIKRGRMVRIDVKALDAWMHAGRQPEIALMRTSV